MNLRAIWKINSEKRSFEELYVLLSHRISKTRRALGLPLRESITTKEFQTLRFQCCCQEVDSALPRVGGVGFAVAIFVVGVFEGVTGIVVNLDLDFLPHAFEGLGKFLHVVGRDAVILRTKEAKDGCVDFFQRFGIGGEVAIVDDVGRESRLLQSDIECSSLRPCTIRLRRCGLSSRSAATRGIRRPHGDRVWRGLPGLLA